jgi:transposase
MMSEGQRPAVLMGELSNSEVMAKAKRRSFSAVYKRKILAEMDAAAGTGGIGQILRREGIYSSTLANWRKERAAAVEGAFSQKRGPEAKHNPLSAENEKLRRQNHRLQEELRKAEIIIDVQKKVAMLLGRPLPPDPSNEKF